MALMGESGCDSAHRLLCVLALPTPV